MDANTLETTPGGSGVPHGRRDIVITLHGIRTEGDWQREINRDLEERGFSHALLRYKNFGALCLLLPRARSIKVDWFRDEYQKLVREGYTNFFLIAHSFGTYIAANAIQKYSEIRFKKIIFCGSIVRPDFDWPAIFCRGQVLSVLNEFGERDVWARTVAWFVKDAGASGATGFSSPDPRLFQNEQPFFKHSDYFYLLHLQGSWLPFLLGNNPINTTPSSAKFSGRRSFALYSLVLLAAVASGVVFLFEHHSFLNSQKAPLATQPTLLTKPMEAQLSGWVHDENGLPLAGVQVSSVGVTTLSKETGYFLFALPQGSSNLNISLQAVKPGYQTWMDLVTPKSNEVMITMKARK
jgi:pimeloyl-ACP methyl ester carboxylesterase